MQSGRRKLELASKLFDKLWYWHIFWWPLLFGLINPRHQYQRIINPRTDSKNILTVTKYLAHTCQYYLFTAGPFSMSPLVTELTDSRQVLPRLCKL